MPKQYPERPQPQASDDPQTDLTSLIQQHFREAEQAIEPVYQRYFASPGAVFSRHWRHKRDIPADLLALPRSLLNSGRRLLRQDSKDTHLRQSGKQQELRRIINDELLDLPGLEQKIENRVNQAIEHYQQQLTGQAELSRQQRLEFEHYVDHQLNRLHLTHEGLREGLLAFTLMITGRALGDKAVLSSAASVGGTLATSAYLSQQGWLAALWAGCMGVPGWVTLAGASAGAVAALLISPLLAPGLEWGMNRFRARRLLQQTVTDAEQQLLKKDGLLAASRLGVYLQILPDIAQFLQRMR